jgi:hypothetical protein
MRYAGPHPTAAEPRRVACPAFDTTARLGNGVAAVAHKNSHKRRRPPRCPPRALHPARPNSSARARAACKAFTKATRTPCASSEVIAACVVPPLEVTCSRKAVGDNGDWLASAAAPANVALRQCAPARPTDPSRWRPGPCTPGSRRRKPGPSPRQRRHRIQVFFARHPQALAGGGQQRLHFIPFRRRNLGPRVQPGNALADQRRRVGHGPHHPRAAAGLHDGWAADAGHHAELQGLRQCGRHKARPPRQRAAA